MRTQKIVMSEVWAVRALCEKVKGNGGTQIYPIETLRSELMQTKAKVLPSSPLWQEVIKLERLICQRQEQENPHNLA